MKPISKLFAMLIKAYQLVISPHFPSRCRYQPSCSEYCRISILRHGVFKGGFLGLKRILRCHPMSHGGYDPVPEHEKSETTSVYKQT